MSQPKEPFMPKLSLLHLIGGVTVSAVAMGVMQQAVTDPSVWSVLLSVLIIALLLPIVLWMITYCIAHLLSSLGGAVVRESLVVEYQPTTRMPTDRWETSAAAESVDVASLVEDAERPIGKQETAAPIDSQAHLQEEDR